MPPTDTDTQPLARLRCLIGLAGYAPERPTLSGDASLLLDLFNGMPDERKQLVMAAVRAIANET